MKVLVYLFSKTDVQASRAHSMDMLEELLSNRTLTLRHRWKATSSLYKVSSFSINFAWKHVILAPSCLLSHSKCDKCLMKTTPHSLVSDNSYHRALLWSKQTLKRRPSRQSTAELYNLYANREISINDFLLHKEVRGKEKYDRLWE